LFKFVFFKTAENCNLRTEWFLDGFHIIIKHKMINSFENDFRKKGLQNKQTKDTKGVTRSHI
jgi:hypothetical protein